MSNMENSSMCYLIRLYGHSHSIASIAVSPNGEYLASGSWDYTICIWKASTGELLKTLIGHFFVV